LVEGNGIFVGMIRSTVQVDEAGRLVLPKPVRERFGLKRGDTLAIEVRGDAIELRPTRAGARLERINGVLVLTGEMTLTGADLVSASREERIDELKAAIVSQK
jgi:AbrB family looped-hinge helix DNA binding protein